MNLRRNNPNNYGYYVVFSRDIEVVGPRLIGFTALQPEEAFISGPWGERQNAEKDAERLRNLARTAIKVAKIWV